MTSGFDSPAVAACSDGRPMRLPWPHARIALAVLSGGLIARAESIDFNRQILPILSDACFRCHGPDGAARKAKLRLDQREGIFRTRDDLTVVTPGKPEASELIFRITSSDEDEVMPPPDAVRRLSPIEIDLLRRWVAGGADWNKHWAYDPPQRPAVPPVAIGAIARRVRNPIDAFVFARLESESLAPAPETEPAALLRRVSLDLTGLPPSPAELDAFVADRTPDAYARAVDRLIASPRYGERWAWEWLDVARYADTNGYQNDPERTMWPWRDWVVDALNANLPFDRFTIEQLAGDLLPEATREQKLATGFNRNNMHNGEGGRIPEETRVENIFDRVDTTATVWLGSTFTCARCHDHKYDPITQRDYYGWFDIFNQMSETGKNSNGQVAPVLDLSSEAERAALKAANDQLDAMVAAVDAAEVRKFPRAPGAPLSESEADKLPGNLPRYIARTEPRKRSVDTLLESIRYFQPLDADYARVLDDLLTTVRERDAAAARVTRVMVMDQIEAPRDTVVLVKGSYENKTDTHVRGAVPAFLRTTTPAEGARLNRLDLARWLVSPENPLAARVTVNRAWQAFFGTGLVKTAEDFGAQGERPVHRELLDWLATEFVASGWDVKALHRRIVTSSTYRQSSRVTPALAERDPDNRLLARGPRHRLPSWMLRDQALAAASLLVEQRGGPAVKPYQPPGIWEEATFGKKTYLQDHGDALYRRSLYVFWRRIVGPTTFFDAGARQVCTVKTARTNTPLHALVTLNDPAFVEAARVMAQRVIAAAPNDSARLKFAFRLATARQPTRTEGKIMLGRLAKLRAEFAAAPEEATRFASSGEAPRPIALPPLEHAAWAGLCLLILNLDETLSKE